MENINFDFWLLVGNIVFFLLALIYRQERNLERRFGEDMIKLIKETRMIKKEEPDEISD